MTKTEIKPTKDRKIVWIQQIWNCVRFYGIPSGRRAILLDLNEPLNVTYLRNRLYKTKATIVEVYDPGLSGKPAVMAVTKAGEEINLDLLLSKDLEQLATTVTKAAATANEKKKQKTQIYR